MMGAKANRANRMRLGLMNTQGANRA
jgi:hypothetical protein